MSGAGVADPRIGNLLKILRETEELSGRGLEDITLELTSRGPGHIIPKLLDLNVNSAKLARAFGLAFDFIVYPWSEKFSKLGENPVEPPLPETKEAGESYIFTKTGVLYVVNPLDADLMRGLHNRLNREGLRAVGIISRAKFQSRSGESSVGAQEAAAGPVAGKTNHEKRLDDILLKAVRLNASDIHFEPQKHDVRVRLRVDNLLHEEERYSIDDYERIANIILSKCKKGKAGTFISALDDMFIFDVPPSRRVKMRVMMIPATQQERQSELPCFCLRILGNTLEQMNLRDLGIPNTQHNPQLTKIRLLTERKNGLILVSGPTGSGKTTTLTAILAEMQRFHPNRCRYTIEDPVEMNLPGVNHVQVNEEADLTFARAIKSFLRGDPDEVLVGEIRDVEVASGALTASITGHLVFSTIHTNSSIETVSRLIDMGCDPYIVASALKASTAQRLARRLCPACSITVRWGELVTGSHSMFRDPENQLMKLRYETAPDLYGDLMAYPKSHDQKVRIASPVGCEKCTRGYKGRMLITELFEVTPKIQDLIANKASVFQLKRQAIRDGFREMWEHGMHEITMTQATSMDELIASVGEREPFDREEPGALDASRQGPQAAATPAGSAAQTERVTPANSEAVAA